jgi:hypothetical protein
VSTVDEAYFGLTGHHLAALPEILPSLFPTGTQAQGIPFSCGIIQACALWMVVVLIHFQNRD